MIRRGTEPAGRAYSEVSPSGVVRPMRSPPASVNHMPWSGPGAMVSGLAPGVIPAENSVTLPAGVILPTRSPSSSVNHRLPSLPTATSSGPLAFDTGKPVAAPPVVRRTMRSARGSVSHSAPRHEASPSCSPPGVKPAEKTVQAPAVVSRPTAEARNSVTHSAPSGPVTIRRGSLPGGSGTGNVVTAPSRVTRPTRPLSRNVNHIAPSGPRAIESGRPGTRTTASSSPLPEIRAT